MPLTLSDTPWLGRGETVSESFSRGANVGAQKAQTQNQRLSLEQNANQFGAEFGLRLQTAAADMALRQQDQELQTKQVNANLISKGLDNQLAGIAIDDTLKDRSTLAEWFAQHGNTPESMINAPLPPVRTAKAQNMALNAKESAAKTTAGQAVAAANHDYFTRISGLDSVDVVTVQSLLKKSKGEITPEIAKIIDLGTEKVSGRKLAAQKELITARGEQALDLATLRSQLYGVNGQKVSELKFIDRHLGSLTRHGRTVDEATKELKEAYAKLNNEEASQATATVNETDPERIGIKEQITALDKQIQEDSKEIAGGDQRYGVFSRKSRLEENKAKRRALQGQLGLPSGVSASSVLKLDKDGNIK